MKAAPSIRAHAETANVATSSELDLIAARLRLRLRLRERWLRYLTQHLSPALKLAAAGFDVGFDLIERDSHADEQAWRLTQGDHATLTEIEQRLAGVPGRLITLNRLLGLSEGESDLLQLCLAVALDPTLDRLIGCLPGRADRPYVSVDLGTRLFGREPGTMWSADSLLKRWRLVDEIAVSPCEAPRLVLDPSIRDWFCGEASLDPVLIECARILPVLEPLSNWPAADLAREIRELLQAQSGAPIRIVLSGAAGSGRKSLAAAVAGILRLPTLAINCDAVDDRQWPDVFLRAQRQGFLDQCALVCHGASLSTRPWLNVPLVFPVQFAVIEPGQYLPSADCIERRFDMPSTTESDRLRLWQQYLPELVTWPAEQRGHLVGRYKALPRDIAAAARNGVRTLDDVAAFFHQLARGQLEHHAQVLESAFTWDDLVVTKGLRAALEDFAYEARARNAFWERPQAQRLFPEGRGLIALFAGPPGTGKTMSAQVIAGALGLALCRVNLATVVSKWVGELAQNLERIFAFARHRNLMLLFDEADALYGKRVSDVRDAQDRFANMDVSHLMTAVESFDGVVILTTNLKSNIDPAFLRRIRYSVEFSKPDAAHRAEIWRKIVSELAGAAVWKTVRGRIGRLAAIEATGAQIKNAVLSANFIAARAGATVGLSHLLAGLNREFAKEGYALSDRELAGVLDG